MAHVFISYSKHDIGFARHLRGLLTTRGFSVWLDESRLAPSSRWWHEIEDNIERCAALIVIMSPAARESDWVEREILYAERLEKPIFPVLLAGDNWPRLANLQYADMRAGLQATLPPMLEQHLSAALAAAPSFSTPQQADRVEPPRARREGRTRTPSRRSGCLVTLRHVVIRTLVVLLAIVLLLLTLYGNEFDSWLAGDGSNNGEEFRGGVNDEFDDGRGEGYAEEIALTIVEPPSGAEIPIHEEFRIGVEVFGVTRPMILLFRFDDHLVDERTIAEPEYFDWIVFDLPEPGAHLLHFELVDEEPIAEAGVEVFGYAP